MNRSDLESLTISNVRGCVQSFTLSFDKHRKLCIVYGENGTGKTTLCDALELLGAGTMGSLDDRGLGKVERYWHPAGQATTRGTIELKAAGAGYVASLKAGRVTWTPDQKPHVRVLRRPQLLRIVTATAAKRYEAIGELVDVSGVEQSEQTLANLVKETERDVGDRTARVAGAQEILQTLFGASTPDGGDSLAWARREAERSDADLLAAAGALEALKTAYDVLVRRQQPYDAARSEVVSAGVAADAATASVTELGAAGSVADAELLAVLEAASKMLASHRTAACPLCEGTEHVAELASRVRERLGAMSALRAARGVQSQASHALAGAQARLAQLEGSYATERSAFQTLLITHSENASGIAIPSEKPPVEIADLAGWLERTAALMGELTRRHRDLTVRASNARSLRNALSTYDENYALAERSSKLLAVLKRGLGRVRAARHTFVNELLADISAEVGRLYEAVHPSEGLASVSLSLDEKRRASLDLLTCFQASDGVPPQAYFSDSHLDTLGLCVFLALAKRRDAHKTVMVLDDVLASVDEPHVDRLIQMIYEEAQHFRHVVVTTHYRPWREKLRWGWLKQGQCQLVELGPWSASVGPSLARSTSEIERLRKVLSSEEGDFDGQAACGKAGVVLEAVLDFLTELYQCKLPRTSRNEWTLGDLLPAIGKKLRAALRVEFQDLAVPTAYTSHEVGPILDELTRIAQTRNLLGAHFNKLSFTLLDADAKHFATKVLELADLLVHPEHGWPRSKKSGSYWSTAQDARRLHPLQEPA